jgi:hypothetical protein
MRDPLDFDLLWNNVNNYLTRTKDGLVTFIVTLNMLSMPSGKRLMQGILELQRIHNVKKTRRDDNGNLTFYGNHRVFVDTPALHYPAWQSLKVLPEEFWHYGDECLEFMKANTDKHRESRWVGFKPHQIQRFERSLDFMKQQLPAQEKIDAQQNFVKFFEEYDKRRGLDFHTTFPELSPYFNNWKASI